MALAPEARGTHRRARRPFARCERRGRAAGGMSGRLVALGDSITRSGGEPMLGLPGSPWVQLLADALGLACENLARDGASAGDVLRDQLPQGRRQRRDGLPLRRGERRARPGVGRDALRRGRGRDPGGPGRRGPAPRLVATIPEDLGRPTAAPKPVEANAIIRAAAGRHGAVVVALDDLTGRDVVLPDAVHLTAAGEAEIARRALAALVARGLAPADATVAAESDGSRRRSPPGGGFERPGSPRTCAAAAVSARRAAPAEPHAWSTLRRMRLAALLHRRRLPPGVEIHPEAHVARDVRFDVGPGARVILERGCRIGDGTRFDVASGEVTVGADALLGRQVRRTGARADHDRTRRSDGRLRDAHRRRATRR